MLQIFDSFLIFFKVVEYVTNSNQTVCACTHLTDFGGGGPFANAAPVELGALKAFRLKSNPTVFSVVMSLFGLYILLLVWARRKDLKDVEKVAITSFLCFFAFFKII